MTSNGVIYLSKEIRDQWESLGYNTMFEFLRYGREFVESFAKFKPEAAVFLEHHPLLKKLFLGGE